MKDLDVVVRFGPGVSSDEQGALLLAWEKLGRELTGKRLELFKETKPDDSKLRSAMTLAQRRSL